MSSNNGNGKSKHYSTFVLLLLASIAIMVMYVEAMAFPSLPTVMRTYGLGPEDYSLASWVVTIYLVVGAVSISIFGKLGDIYGKKRMLIIAMMIYTVMVSLTGFASELSSSIYLLIIFRALQGIAMAMFPLAFGLIRDEFPPDRIPIAQGVISAMFGVGTAVGFVIGGFVTETLGWQWTYHTIAPFALVMTVVAYFKIRESPVRLNAKVDYVGAALLGATLVTFLVGVTETSSRVNGVPRGWSDPMVVALLVASAVFVTLFVLWLPRAKDPLVRPSLMKVRNLALMNITAFMIGFALFTTIQTIAGLAAFNFQLDTIQIGLLLLPTSAVTLVLGPTVGFLVRRIGPKWPLTFGMTVAIVGFMMLYFNHSTKLDVMLGVTVLGAGQAFAMVSSINIVIVSTPMFETGISTAVNTIIRTAGSVVGPAIAAVIISQNSHFDPVVGQAVPGDIAYRTIFLMASIVMALGVFLSLFIQNQKSTPQAYMEGGATGTKQPVMAKPAEADLRQ